MGRGISVKTFLRGTRKEQQVELIHLICLPIPPDDLETDPIELENVFSGAVEDIPRKYENFKVYDWGIRGKNIVNIEIGEFAEQEQAAKTGSRCRYMTLNEFAWGGEDGYIPIKLFKNDVLIHRGKTLDCLWVSKREKICAWHIEKGMAVVYLKG